MCSQAGPPISPSCHRQRCPGDRRTNGQSERLFRRDIRFRRGQSHEPQAVHRSRLGHFRRPHDQFQLHVGHRQRHADGSSGGTAVASIDLVGAYTSSSFHLVSGISGTVAITDPEVVNGGSSGTRACPSPGQARRRPAGPRLRRRRHARLCSDGQRRQHADSPGWPPRCNHRPPRQLHGWKLRLNQRKWRGAGHATNRATAACWPIRTRDDRSPISAIGNLRHLQCRKCISAVAVVKDTPPWLVILRSCSVDDCCHPPVIQNHKGRTEQKE